MSLNPKIGHPSMVCSAERVTINGGAADGMRLICVSNGKINFTLSENNALDIHRFWHEGTNVGYVAKPGLYAKAETFGYSFNAGLLYTCGLDCIGGIEGHRPHGRLHTITAEVLECRADEEGVKITAEIRASQLFGENLILTRTYETKAGSDTLTLRDTLTNKAFRTEDYCMMYHVNVGYPIVDEGTRVVADIKESLPRTPFAEETKDTMLVMGAPVDNQEETCYFQTLNTPEIGLANDKLGKQFTLSYKSDILPGVVEWKSQASGDYVIGLEPCTSFLDEHFAYRQLKSGESVTNEVTFTVKNIG